MRELCLTCLLATRDWCHEWLLSLCMVLSLGSVLVPLLVIGGIKYGVITTLTERLNQDPAILSITPTGSGAYTREWIAELARKPEVRFAIVRTRDIAATMQLVSADAAGQTRRLRVSLEPTGVDDPLLPVQPGNDNSVVLSHNAAQKLGVQAGATITGQLGRKTPEGALESTDLPLRVDAVLPLNREDRDIAYVTLPLLEDAENYRDYIAVPRRNFSGAPGENAHFASFRLYASDLSSVAVLRDYFTEQGIEVYTKAQEISFVQGLDRSLTIIFGLIAVPVGIGAFASMASNVLAAVRRKDRQLGMLRLIGFSGLAMMLYPIVQSMLTSVAATLLAGALYLGLSVGINTLFAAHVYGGAVCAMPFSYYLLTLLGVIALSVLASLQAARRVAGIDPSLVLRDI